MSPLTVCYLVSTNLEFLCPLIKVDILQMNESKLDSTVLDDDVYIPGFAEVRKVGQLTEGMEVVYVQMCALI